MGDVREAAVLIPLVAADDPLMVFTQRTESVRSHKGQISFPGGAIDRTDPSPQHAALRETQEEIGLDPHQVRVLGELDNVPTFVSGYVIAPFVGWLDEQPTLTPNPAEVAEVLQVPVSEINESIRAEPGFRHQGRSFPTEAWIWRDKVIWGVTARLLRMFLDLLAEAGLAETPGTTTSWTAWPLPRAVTDRP